MIREGPSLDPAPGAAGASAGWLPLNGCAVTAEGAWAVGMQGLVVRRDGGPGAAWREVAGVPLASDWHAVWVDPRGDAWVVGGRLTTSVADRGAVVRFGPPRGDLDAVTLDDLDATSDTAPDVSTGDSDDVDSESDATLDATLDATPDAVDATPDDAVDTADAPDIAPADAVEPPSDPTVVLGDVDLATGAFVAYAEGQDVELVQGTQGLLHVWLALDLAVDSDVDPLPVRIAARTIVGGATVGHFTSAAYPTPRVEPGHYRTYAMTVIFDQVDAPAYEGLSAALAVEVEPRPGDVRAAHVDVILVDRE